MVVRRGGCTRDTQTQSVTMALTALRHSWERRTLRAWSSSRRWGEETGHDQLTAAGFIERGSASRRG